MSTVLVLGGTSWVGGQIAREAVQRGHEVTCLARGESGEAPAGVRFVRADRCDPEAYDEVRDGHRNNGHWDIVVDVARQPGQVRSAVAALGAVTTHWTLVSTGSVYADQSIPLTEESPLLTALHAEVGEPEQYGEGKVACELAVGGLERHLIVRAGMIGGPGDRSDRLGYWVSRFALAGAEPVLVPRIRDQPMQVIDVRDLARWIVIAAEGGATGIVHGVGERTTVGQVVDLSAEVAGFTGEQVIADESWLREHDVEEWMGPRSLALWLPVSHHGMGMMDDSRARSYGLVRRPLVETLRDTLDDERRRGLDRSRVSGLDRADELALIAELGGFEDYP